MGRPTKVQVPEGLSPDERAKFLKSESAKRFYSRHKDKILAGNKLRRELNLEADLERQRAYYQAAKPQRLETMAAYAKKSPRTVLKARLKHKYALSVEDYEYMLADQGHVCAICKCPNNDGKRLAVDHDHATGRVRGLLCNPCNLAVGHMKDDPTRLRQAAEYLEESRGNV